MMQYQLCAYPEIKYDPIADAILIRIATGDYGESDTLDSNEDVIFNFDTDGNILSLEIISAIRHKDLVSNLIFNNSIFSWDSFSPSTLLPNLQKDLSQQNSLQTS